MPGASAFRALEHITTPADSTRQQRAGGARPVPISLRPKTANRPPARALNLAFAPCGGFTLMRQLVAETDLRAAVAERLGESRFSLWFGEGVKLGVDGDSLRVNVPNGFFREWIQAHFAENLIDAAQALAGRPLTLDFHMRPRPNPNSATW